MEVELKNCNQLNEKNKGFEDNFGKSQERFKTVFEKSELGNKIIGEDLAILEVNEALVNLLGFSSPKDLINRKVIEFAHPDYIKHWHKLQEALWQEKISTFALDTCLIKKDGTVIWCHVNSILFEDAGKTFGYTILENINDRKMLELKAK